MLKENHEELFSVISKKNRQYPPLNLHLHIWLILLKDFLEVNAS